MTHICMLLQERYMQICWIKDNPSKQGKQSHSFLERILIFKITKEGYCCSDKITLKKNKNIAYHSGNRTTWQCDMADFFLRRQVGNKERNVNFFNLERDVRDRLSVTMGHLCNYKYFIHTHHSLLRITSAKGTSLIKERTLKKKKIIIMLSTLFFY